MRIVVWGINYAPEKVGIAPCNVALCEYLVGQGNKVSMVTAFPYYPAWKKLEGDRGRLFGIEEMNGVRVLRCWQYVPQSLSTAKRLLHRLDEKSGSITGSSCADIAEKLFRHLGKP